MRTQMTYDATRGLLTIKEKPAEKGPPPRHWLIPVQQIQWMAPTPEESP